MYFRLRFLSSLLFCLFYSFQPAKGKYENADRVVAKIVLEDKVVGAIVFTKEVADHLVNGKPRDKDQALSGADKIFSSITLTGLATGFVGEKIFGAVATYVGLYIAYSQYLVAKEIIDTHYHRKVPLFNIIDHSKINETFASVIGQKSAKKELQFLLNYLNNKENYHGHGAQVPKGILFYGPSGTGKTLLARAFAKELKGCFLLVNGPSDILDKYVGVAEQRVKKLFEYARLLSKKQLVVIFIDEIDSLIPQRSSGESGGFSAAHDSITNQFLIELDGIEKDKNQNIVVIGATNRKDRLDAAALRPGRFDAHVLFELPERSEREQILDYYLKSRSHGAICTKDIAKLTHGFSAADLEGLVASAQREAFLEKSINMQQSHFDEVLDQKFMGGALLEDSSTPEEMEKIARHEAGHALMAYAWCDYATIYKATICPRGQILGFVKLIQKNEHSAVTKEDIYHQIAMTLGGRVSEQLYYGDKNVSAGASSDLAQATHVANQMICSFGMGDHLSSEQADVLMPAKQKYEMINEILRTQENKVRTFLQNNKKALDALSQALLKYKTLSGADITILLSNIPLVAMH